MAAESAPAPMPTPEPVPVPTAAPAVEPAVTPAVTPAAAPDPRAALLDELATEPEPEALPEALPAALEPVPEPAPQAVPPAVPQAAPAPSPAPVARPSETPGRPMRMSARTDSGRLVNNLATVSDAGLIEELETLTTRLSRDQGQSVYDYVENQFSVDAGAKLAVATRDGKGPSMQAKAQRRVQLTQGVVDRVVAELERRGIDPAAELVRRAEASNTPLAEGATDFDPAAFEDEAFPTSLPASVQPARTAQMERGVAPPLAPVPSATARPASRPSVEEVAARNFRRPLADFAPTAYREMSPYAALGMLEGQHVGPQGDTTFLATSPEMALGQGANRGVLVELDTQALQGQVNTSKPMWAPSYESGAFELVARDNTDAQYQQAIRAVTVRPGTPMQTWERRRLDGLTRDGWSKTANADGSVTYRPPAATTAPRSPSGDPAADPVAAALSTLNDTLTALRQDLTQARDGAAPGPAAPSAPERPAAEGSGTPTAATAASAAPAAEAVDDGADLDDDGAYLPDAELLEVDDEAGAEPRYAYTDPMAAAIGEAARRIKETISRRTADTAPLFASQFPEVEARLRKGEQGLPTLSLRQRVQKALAGITAGLRHFPELDATRDAEHALINEALLSAERSGSVSQAKAADSLLQIVQGLSASEVQLMSRKLALDDILKDIDAGLYDRGNPVPFYGRDANDRVVPVGEARGRVLQDQAKVERVVRDNAKVAAAIERRATFAKALTTQLVEIGNLDASVLDDPRYYHRQVLAAAEKRLLVQQGQWTGVGAPRDARVKSRGFMKQRTGGGDFNLAYIEAEYEWVAQGYQNLLLHEVLQTVKAFDRTPELKADAHRWNVDRFYEQVDAAGGEDPLAIYAQRIAAGRQRIVRELLHDRVTVPPAFARMVQALLEAEAAGERFAHPQWFPFLSQLVQQDNAAGKAAAGIYKAMAERKQAIKDALGADYVNPADQQALLAMAGDEFDIWQPEKGNVFYSALTVSEKELAELLRGGPVDVAQLQRLMVMGGKKPGLILPAGIVKTLNNLKPAESPTNILDAALKTEVRAWKVWTLLNPTRVIKYNLNNISSDIEVAIMLPGVGPKIAQAAADLWRYQRTRDLSAPATAELQTLLERGVIGQTQTTTEIPDIKTFEEFRHLATMPPNAFMAMAAVYWDHARGLTTWRENVLRLAAYRYFLDQLNQGRRVYGASNRTRVDALQSNEEKAALLSRDMLGDYGNISSLGQTVRDRFLPFYSWMEVNTKRFVNLARNARHEEGGWVGGAGTRVAGAFGLGALQMGVRAGARLGMAGVLASAFMAAVAIYNATMWGDEWEELRKAGRDGHLILGKTSDGDIITVRVEGAFADFLSWVGMKDLPHDIVELWNGEVGYGDLLGDAILAPVKKIAGSLEPMTQALYSFLTGKSLFPNPLEPRTLRDPLGRAYGALFDAWSLGLVYRNVMLPLGGVPADPRPASSELVNLIAYRTDGGQLAYDAARSMTYTWLEKEGRHRPGGANTKKSAALYYYRKALQYGEDDAARAWFQRYVALGGTREAAKQSLKRAGPLAAIPLTERNRFLATLDAQERDVVKRAHQFYHRQMLGPSQRTMERPAPAASAKEPVPFSLSWYLEQAGAMR
ncbi:hypothetical protein [Gemmatimonas sp. UBA7669]|uniref:hypothetical protein n=1 Tax=Gemmatimonas sp. UBA7669 TaxID=1946568 RepID=UPI0025BD1478|nr:hypothetical protein [Gemmatimonas sp. UBA7669]